MNRTDRVILQCRLFFKNVNMPPVGSCLNIREFYHFNKIRTFVIFTDFLNIYTMICGIEYYIQGSSDQMVVKTTKKLLT